MKPTPAKTVWDLSPLLQGDTDPSFEEKIAEASQAVDRFVANWKDNKAYLGDADTLKTALDEYELLYAIHGTAGAPEYYFGLRSTQEENNSDIKARLNKTNEQSLENHNKLQFFELSLSTLPMEKLQEFIDSPKLADYRHFLERLAANASHLLSEAEERILALKSQPSHGNWVQMLSGQLSERQRETVDEQGERKSRTLPELSSMLQSTDKEVRDQAAAAINQIIYEIREIAEAELNSVLLNKKINDQLRSMSRPDLGRHLSDDIDSVTVDSLVEAVAEGFPLVHRYYRLKASLLGLPSLAYHERNVPYGTDNSKYEYDEAVQIVKSAFVKLDPEFASIFQSFLDNGQIDVFPRPGKRGGAFCTHDLKVFPTYILLNHTDTLQDVLTLAHELGHGINNELIRKSQNSLNFGTPMSTAEVASTFMEDFVMDSIITKADDETRLQVMMKKLDDDIGTIFRQIACYRFEQELHSSFRTEGYLSNSQIGELFRKHMSAYMGEAVEQSEGSENWWIQWHHIRTFFYVYSYASGLLISKALQRKVKENPSFITQVKTFLSTGLSKSPHSLFMELGVDINDPAFWKQGVAEFERSLKEAEDLAKSLGKI